MGDTLGDPVMADGIEDRKEIIKIGFLNKDVCIMLPKYVIRSQLLMKTNLKNCFSSNRLL